MISRRKFLLLSFATAIGAFFFSTSGSVKRRISRMKTRNPRKALVTWFSQTGHTERIGRIIAAELREKGIEVTEGDIREIDSSTVPNYELIVMGSPVYYADVPVTQKEWIESIPSINGIPVASYVTFGGAGDNQHNTACYLLDHLSDKGGVPVAMKIFSNMSTFAPTWSSGRSARILQYRNLPNEETFQKARDYAESVITIVESGQLQDISYKIHYGSLMRYLVTGSLMTLFIGRHRIVQKKCVQCGLCEDKCPASVITIDNYRINTDNCVACFGCVNLCPMEAHDMTFMGNKLYGFREFLRRNRIQIEEPHELNS